jgi:hypothetical protein
LRFHGSGLCWSLAGCKPVSGQRPELVIPDHRGRRNLAFELLSMAEHAERLNRQPWRFRFFGGTLSEQRARAPTRPSASPG